MGGLSIVREGSVIRWLIMTYYEATIIEPGTKSTQKTRIRIEAVMVMIRSKGEDVKR